MDHPRSLSCGQIAVEIEVRDVGFAECRGNIDLLGRPHTPNYRLLLLQDNLIANYREHCSHLGRVAQEELELDRPSARGCLYSALVKRFHRLLPFGHFLGGNCSHPTINELPRLELPVGARHILNVQ